MAKAVGIDLGTTFSVAAFLDGQGRPVVIPGPGGNRFTPSVVAILENGQRIAGAQAKDRALIDPERTVFSVKRKMGRRTYLELAGSEVIAQIKRRMGSDFRVSIGDREYTPEEISAVILRKLKEDAERYLGAEVRKAVVSVPAYFNITQRQATLDAGAIAGLDVMRIIDEPTAAALAYGADLAGAETIMVWDLGGGTFDVSVLELGDGVFEVKGVCGDNWLGGDDYDSRLAGLIAEGIEKEHGVDPRKDGSANIMLRELAEQCKMELSKKTETRVTFDFPVLGKKLRWERTISRQEFERLTSDLVERMAGPAEKALRDAGLAPGDIDRVLMVGGSTRMPQVRKAVERLMGKGPCFGVNPDEAVAMGAAIQAGILLGQVKRKVLIDVIPISIGVETEGGVFTRLIERNTSIPAAKSRIFTNSFDNQASMDIHVLQGERAMAADNITMDSFELDGISPALRGESLVEVRFEINANGVLNVSATDLRSEKSSSIRVSPRFYGLPKEEIERMLREAEEHEDHDRIGRARAEAAIAAANMVSAARLQAGEAAASGEITALADALEAALGEKDAPEIERLSAELKRLMESLPGWRAMAGNY
ncbi:MAG TPA: molecular chaperone DnaK [Deltaproteobacteria bacterium]|nr:MAG: hypothetical protein A2Z79_11620 [Deltaproteobacteria bacterium GWA2_55_82]OGQ63517.1 MAG: hypothetical protein A3I81_05810 [Deltaproteobacteria bacterium RIFCSPLOWO2_02_FULL_55_12]OIJ74899.1 MAG: hypothetical protein A2V21_311865 [Deltaproteobacteria bacterium GWC2_55_46]HBG47449.1 molecular chaperone DnaK [Deltaproteobacteria bacterium]HCY11465.1 molecular chaperone DnaK [Deltaproteobacteria bacterium]